jgi:methylisocitrate lyase
MSSSPLRGLGARLSEPAGQRLRQIVRSAANLKKPAPGGGVVPVVGVPNAYCALLAHRAGLPLIYLSGNVHSASSLGLPDLGLATLDEVLEDVRRITRVSSLPLLVDADTGFGGIINVARTTSELERAGAAGMHIEDQEAQYKRCEHRLDKRIVPTAEMVERIRAAVAARRDQSFVIMARTDAFASEGIDATLKRAQAYIEAGADMLFPEALLHIEHFKAFTSAFPDTPVLANLTEFGRTPLFSLEELSQAKVSLALFPVSAFRAMAQSAQRVYEVLRETGSQSSVAPLMQTRQEIRQVLGYEEYEQMLDRIYPPSENSGSLKEKKEKAPQGSKKDQFKEKKEGALKGSTKDVSAEAQKEKSTDTTEDEKTDEFVFEDEGDEETIKTNSAAIEKDLEEGKEIELKD